MSRRSVLLGLVAMLLLGTACGGVQSLRVDDPRLSIESRRTLAAAQDALAVTRADLDAAREELANSRTWRARFSDSRQFGSNGAAAATARAELGHAKVQAATLAVEAAQRRVELEQTKHDLVTARLSIRHEIALYDVDSLDKKAEEQRGVLRQALEKLRAHDALVREKEATWWTTYRAYLKAGGDKRTLWLP